MSSVLTVIDNFNIFLVPGGRYFKPYQNKHNLVKQAGEKIRKTMQHKDKHPKSAFIIFVQKFLYLTASGSTVYQKNFVAVKFLCLLTTYRFQVARFIYPET